MNKNKDVLLYILVGVTCLSIFSLIRNGIVMDLALTIRDWFRSL